MIDREGCPVGLQDLIYPLGAVWDRSSLIWGEPAGSGDLIEQRSPLDGSLLQRISLLSCDEIDHLLREPRCRPIDPRDVWSFAGRLYAELHALAPALLDAMQRETGFIKRDCAELLDSALSYILKFRDTFAQNDCMPSRVMPYTVAGQRRQIRLVRIPWGTVAVILPQNAFLLMAVTVLLNALVTGNCVILRAPQQSARSAALLSAAVRAADAPWNAVSVVLVQAKRFLNGLYQTQWPGLIHFMGSSQHGLQVLAQGSAAGKMAIVDGSGNTWVWVDANVSIKPAAAMLVAGATRYNGQTCTSINGAVIHPAIYWQLRAELVEQWAKLRAGNPLEDDVDVGPLFDESQAQWCEQQLIQSGGRLIYGGGREGCLLQPTLVEFPCPDSALVREGLFGPGLWIRPGLREEFTALWRRNCYPLCAGVLSENADVFWWLARLTNGARLVVNGDPSIEYIFEPWGGYPGSGFNHVGVWHEKYTRVVSLDTVAPPRRHLLIFRR